MNVIAAYRSVLVEVLDVWATSDGRKVAEVKSLDGSTFQSWSHGGWCESDTRIVLTSLLHPVKVCDSGIRGGEQ